MDLRAADPSRWEMDTAHAHPAEGREDAAPCGRRGAVGLGFGGPVVAAPLCPTGAVPRGLILLFGRSDTACGAVGHRHARIFTSSAPSSS